MAINIFQSGPSKGKAVNSASSSTRAQQAKQALAAPAEASNSGTTAVAKKGTLSKVGNFIGKAADTVSKFLPGIGGTIAKGIAGIFNDPEWWQSVPGDAVTVNAPLRLIALDNKRGKIRPAIAEFVSCDTSVDKYVISPTTQMITQYLMPQIRKVVNAVPLQEADSYNEILNVNATVYSLWRQLLKVDYLLKHGQTYLANMSDVAFPVFQVSNAAWLQSTINRLEEYLRANVRLPHTMCEYLAWRYGRVYRANTTAKAALIMYNVVSLSTSIQDLNSYIDGLLATPASEQKYQVANTDIYNAYFDHDLNVEIREDTQCHYDCKEFLLRTNCDVSDDMMYSDTPNTVYIDSALDNPTTFMASTVSTRGVDMSGTQTGALFGVRKITAYMPIKTRLEFTGSDDTDGSRIIFEAVNSSSNWGKCDIMHVDVELGVTKGWKAAIGALTVCKALDIYNKDINVMIVANEGIEYIDVTSISMDMGLVPDSVIGNEHVFAFANLVDQDRKQSLSYQKAEAMVAKDTANLIDTLDVASAGTAVQKK